MHQHPLLKVTASDTAATPQLFKCQMSAGEGKDAKRVYVG